MENSKTILSLIDKSRFCLSLQKLLESRFVLQFSTFETELGKVSNPDYQVPPLLVADLSGLKKFGGQLVLHLGQNGKDTQIVCICQSWPESEEIFFLSKILSIRLMLVEPIIPDLALVEIVNIEATDSGTKTKDRKSLQMEIKSGTESFVEIDPSAQNKINTAVALLREEASVEWKAFARAFCHYQANESEEQRKLLIATAHRLKGSLGCLGLKTASNCARNFELCLEAFHTNNPCERRLWWQYMHRLVEEGETCIKQVEEPQINAVTFNDDAGTLALLIGKQDRCQRISKTLASKSFNVEQIELAEELAGYVNDDAPAYVFVAASLAPIPKYEICRYLRTAKTFKETTIFCIDGACQTGYQSQWKELGIHVVPSEEACLEAFASIVTDRTEKTEAQRQTQ